MSYKKINETKPYKLAFELAMKVFIVSKSFPEEVGRFLSHMINHPEKYK